MVGVPRSGVERLVDGLAKQRLRSMQLVKNGDLRTNVGKSTLGAMYAKNGVPAFAARLMKAVETLPTTAVV